MAADTCGETTITIPGVVEESPLSVRNRISVAATAKVHDTLDDVHDVYADIVNVAEVVSQRVKAKSRRILANRWQYLRLVIAVPILVGTLAGTYFLTSTVDEKKLLGTEEFILSDCGLTISRVGISDKKTWESVLTETRHQRFRIRSIVGNYTFPPDNQTIFFASSIIYQIMPVKVLRGLSFGILPHRTLLVTLRYNTSANCGTIDVASTARQTSKMFADAGRDGKVVLSSGGPHADQEYDAETGHFRPVSISGLSLAFFVLNVVVVWVAAPVIIYISLKLLRSQWRSATTGWVEFYFPEVSDDGALDNKRSVACGILFVAEHLCGNPIANTSSLSKALISTAVHIGLILAPTVPLIAFRFFLASSAFDDISYVGMAAYVGVAVVHISLYYTDVRWRYQRPFSAAFVAVYFLAYCAFVVLAVNTVIWFVLGMVIEPVRCASVLLFIASIVFYAYFSIHEFTNIRHKVSAAYKDVKGVILQKLGLSLTDMYVMIVGGILIVVCTATFLLVGYLTFDGSANSIAGIIPAVVTPIVSFVTKFTQLNAVKNRVRSYDVAAIGKDMSSRLALIKLD
eukprot:Opistho-2@40553